MSVTMKSAPERMRLQRSQFLAHHSKNQTNHSNSEARIQPSSSSSEIFNLDELTVHEERLWIPLFGCLFFFVALFFLALRMGCLTKQSQSKRDYDEIQASEDDPDACVNPSHVADPPQHAGPRRVMWASGKPAIAPRGSASDAQQVQVLKAELRDVSIRLSASEQRELELQEAVELLASRHTDVEAQIEGLQAELEQLRRARRAADRAGSAAFSSRLESVRLGVSSLSGPAGRGGDEDAGGGYAGTYGFVRPASAASATLRR